MGRFIHEKEEWPNFRWDDEKLIALLGRVRNLQGRLFGRMQAVGFELKLEANLEAIAQEVIKSSEIEGEILNPEQVRSSIAKRLGMDRGGMVPSNKEVDGIVDLLLDAIQRFDSPLTEERLFDWHYSLFPTGRTGMYKIRAGQWRDDSAGPMQVVSGALGKEKVHFEAPAAERIPGEMARFLDWFNGKDDLDPLIKAGVAHLWFVTIHPFEDGNGRTARALTDMLLTRSDGVPQRFYSMSTQIRKERREYYEILEETQQGGLNITKWMEWFLHCLSNAIGSSDEILEKVMFKHHFLLLHAGQTMNNRQQAMLNRLLGDFEGKLTTKKWAKMTKCSHDTALRDIQDLIEKGILRKEREGGRSANYELIF